MSWTVWLMESHTPAAPSTDHTMRTETIVTMPKAIESRNAVFMTDQGSIRLSRSRARRGGLRPCAALRTAGGEPGLALARCSSAALVSFAEIRSPRGARAAVSSLLPLVPLWPRVGLLRMEVRSAGRSVIRLHPPRWDPGQRPPLAPGTHCRLRLLHPRPHP